MLTEGLDLDEDQLFAADHQGKWKRFAQGARDNPASRPCFICGETGHWRNDCPKKGQAPPNNPLLTAIQKMFDKLYELLKLKTVDKAKDLNE